ncbi:hypothetical protein PG991_003073, partial [Apiospora marii]
SVLALLCLLQFVHGQQPMPLCASKCLETHLKQSSCSATDFPCICADEQLQANVGTCMLGSCTLVESLAAMNVTKTICKEPIRDNSTTTPVVTAISAALAVIFVAIRVLNNHLRGSLNIADWCAVLALWTWISEFTYVPAIGLTKICILFFYLRVFPSRGFRYACFGTIAFVVAFSLATFTVTIFSCSPVDFVYKGWAGDSQGTCININAFWFSQATINITTDLWIMVLPITQIKKLDLERKKKIFLCIMFCVGLLVTVFSIIRFTGLVSYSSTTNPTYNNVGAATWSVLECNVGIVCCCMPYVRSLLNRVFPNCFGGTFFSSGGKRGQKYHTMTSTTAAASGKADGGDGTSKLQSQTTNATATTDGGGVDDGRKCGSRVSRGGGAENTRGTADRSDTIELAPMEGTLARYPEW